MATRDKFSDWIKEYGVHNLVGELKVHQTTVESWGRRRFIPSAFNMKAIVKLAKGKISYADIIEPFCLAHPEQDRYSREG